MNTVHPSFKITFTLLILAGATTVFANPKSPGPGQGDVPRPVNRNAARMDTPGRQVPSVPRGAISLTYGGGNFFFHAGVFLKWNVDGYVVVEAPVGILVPALPLGCQVEVVAGQPYYVIGNTYYRQVRGGYRVVASPRAQGVVVAASAPASSGAQNVTVWLENPNGSKTPVKLEPADDGQWIGPKGEYYPTFPTEAQLEPVYGLPGGAKTEAQTSGPTIHTLWIENTNGSKTPVELIQTADGHWQGPNEEIYETLPSESDLRTTYGL
ncbi:hypothetical protein P3T73_10245 [Kiritimatiellota bacterium B12222]|nr:hypothetical protein P3T73_10245 [Kiritimatiellota bacterium B12222]